MSRRRSTALVALTLALSTAACTGGDDAAPGASTAAPATAAAAPTTASGPITVAPSSAAPTTSLAPSTAAPTTATPTTATPTTEALPPTTAAPTNRPPRVEAAAFAVYDMRSGEFLARREAHARRPVASLIKLLTAYVGYAAGDPTRVVRAPGGLVLFPGDESVIGIERGQMISRDVLIRAMLKVSANDAARMLAIDIAGSEAAYAELMNAAAQQLGLDDTHAVNVTGLDAEGQYSSADDIVRLGVLLMSNVTFQQTVKEETATLNDIAYANTNDLLGVYPGADGIKTGRTSGAGWCILASATLEGRRIVVAVLGAPTEAARDQAATALLDWGFAQG